MTPNDLDRLLQRIDDGVATPEERERVEAFLQEAEESALLADALRDEAGPIDLADAILAKVAPHEPKVPVAEAVRDEAGTVDVAEDVALFSDDAWISAMLDHELEPRVHRLAARHLMTTGAGVRMTELAEVGHVLREAVSEEAGQIDLWDDVAHGLGVAHPEEVAGWDGSLLAEAVRAEAGRVDVADEVVSRVRRSALAAGPTAAPVAANDRTVRRWVGSLALAAALVLGVMVGREVTRGPDAPAAFDIQFASADEIAITDLTYAEDADVTVFQGSDDNAPLIIWVEEHEEANL